MGHDRLLDVQLGPVEHVHDLGVFVVVSGHLLAQQLDQEIVQIEFTRKKAELLHHQFGTLKADAVGVVLEFSPIYFSTSSRPTMFLLTGCFRGSRVSLLAKPRISSSDSNSSFASSAVTMCSFLGGSTSTCTGGCGIDGGTGDCVVWAGPREARNSMAAKAVCFMSFDKSSNCTSFFYFIGKPDAGYLVGCEFRGNVSEGRQKPYH